MKSINIKRLLIVSLIIGLFLASNVMAQEEIIDPDIPESWYQAPQTASELDIKEFNQSPMLNEKVNEGELLPVEERLPDDPPVIEPLKEVGEYGGTAYLWDTNLNFWGNAMYLCYNPSSGGQPTPDGDKMIPWFIKDWEYSNGYKDMTLYLREGLKWSDGEPFTADDYIYWWEHVAQNEDLNPVPPEEWSPPILDVTKNNKWEITLHFGKSSPRYHDFNLQGGYGVAVEPAHYMKQFHPDFIGEEKANELAKENELDHWSDYYGRIMDESYHHPEYEHSRPHLFPYVAVERTENRLLVERNPYFPFIDTKGNQLPYIDKVNIQLANEDEMARTKATTGEATIAARYLDPSQIPLYKKNEEKENYKTLIYSSAYGSQPNIQPNLTHEDKKLRAIFQDIRFRKALSLALDREDINRKIYYGEAVPMQATVPPVNRYYEERFGKAFANYDPERAKELLDEMDMVDRNGDGYREMPEGTLDTMSGEEVEYDSEIFNPTVFIRPGPPGTQDATLELAQSAWQEIGLDIRVKMISGELYNQRMGSNKMDIGTWAIDAAVTLSFGDAGGLSKAFSPLTNAAQSGWPAWARWVDTGGKEGMEPPKKIKEIIDFGQTLSSAPEPEIRAEAANKLLEANAENIWTIGIVGMLPTPIIVSKDLGNVPQKGVWDWGTRYIKPYQPMQFYFKE